MLPDSESEEIFWQLIDGIKSSEYEKQNSSAESGKDGLAPPNAESLQTQLLKTIIGLKNQVKNGTLPVKTITDAFNQWRSKESQSQDPEFGLTYHRIGRLLSTMGFIKAKTRGGCSAIIWDDKLLSQNTFSNAQNSYPQDD